MSLLYFGFAILCLIVLRIEVRNYRKARRDYIQARNSFEQMEKDRDRFYSRRKHIL